MNEMGSARAKDLICRYLKNKKTASTNQIITYLNRKMKYGVTTNQVGNLLARHPRIEKAYFLDETKPNGHRNRQCVWKLKD